jgi:FkbM family methyltransferase
MQTETATRTVRVPSLEFDFEVLEGDLFIGPAIEKGAWEEHETRLFRAHLRPGARVVDLGANVGWFAVQAILAGAEVDAFEPVPEIAAVCERNVARANERGPGHGRVHHYAAGAVPTVAKIVLAPENRGDNRVLDEGGAAPADLPGARRIEIRVQPVDHHVQGPVDILKIDTQGSEFFALQGASQLLRTSPDLVLLMEFWPYALRGAEPRELLEVLEVAGFTVGKATAAPYPMKLDRILKQAEARDPVKGGLDLYAVRGDKPFHVLGPMARLKSVWRSIKE